MRSWRVVRNRSRRFWTLSGCQRPRCWHGRIVVELLGGLAVFVGAFIPLASIPMVIVLVVAIFSVHLPNGFPSIKLMSVDAAGAHFGQPGYETDLLYCGARCPGVGRLRPLGAGLAPAAALQSGKNRHRFSDCRRAEATAHVTREKRAVGVAYRAENLVAPARFSLCRLNSRERRSDLIACSGISKVGIPARERRTRAVLLTELSIQHAMIGLTLSRPIDRRCVPMIA
ncbi:MAG: DoxX family protein [Rhodopila sp.]|nr:DoxX family protein [Rhodopila sp.]